MLNSSKQKIAIIGCGYVGLPLLISLSDHFDVMGLEKSKLKIKQIFDENIDYANIKKLKKNNVFITNDYKDISSCNVFIICVPTPVTSLKKPNLNLLVNVLKSLSILIKKNDLIIFESTYHPGTSRKLTQRYICNKNLKINKNLFIGYSPERINPGDDINTLKNTTKLISGDSDKTIKQMSEIYSKVCKKLHFCKTIEEAEMSKLIENTQRDINIAYINEIFKICNSSNIKFTDVLNSASTKWNFIKFIPGLVGGHCISVDTYYLKEYADLNGIKSKTITSGRQTNENMKYFYFSIIKSHLLNKKNKILFLGKSFKANVSDYRNSKNIELINLFKKIKSLKVFSFDPFLDSDKMNIEDIFSQKFDLIIILVAHKKFDTKFIKKINNLNLYKNGKVLDFTFRNYKGFSSKKMVTF